MAALTAIVVGLVRYTSLPKPRRTISNQSCPILSAEEKVARADIVLTGQVEMVLPQGPLGAQAIIKPITIYKGAVATPNVIVDAQPANDAGQPTAISLNLASEQSPYLFFLHSGGDQAYRTSACDGTRPFGSGLTSAENQALEVGGTSTSKKK
jgi:hypothetical protein